MDATMYCGAQFGLDTELLPRWSHGPCAARRRATPLWRRHRRPRRCRPIAPMPPSPPRTRPRTRQRPPWTRT